MSAAPNHSEEPGVDIVALGNQMSIVESLTRGEVDMQVATAKRFPRSLTKFKQDALAMATLDTETAEACFYVLSRSGKTIEGPGVRLAEIVASCWGNLRNEQRIVSEDGRFITAQATCWDMERNVLCRVEVRRRITDKWGKTFSDDMIGVTGNAAASIAGRNAIFKVIPSAYVRAIYEEARKVAVGDSRTLADRRQRALDYFGKAGVSTERLLAAIGKAGVEDIDVQALTILAGTRTAIQEGTTTIDEAFPPVASDGLKAGTISFGSKKEEKPAETKTKAPAPAPDSGLEQAEERWAKEKAAAEEPTKAKRERKKDPPKSALDQFFVDALAAKSEAELDELFKKTGSMPPADIQPARSAITARRAELEFAGEPPHDANGVVLEETEAGARG